MYQSCLIMQNKCYNLVTKLGRKNLYYFNVTFRLEPRQRIMSAFSAARLAPFQLMGQAMEPRSPK